MKIDTVLFDLDGTLVDSLPLIKRTYQRVFQEMNIPWENDEVMTWVGRSLKDIGNYFAGEERGQEFFKVYQHYYAIDHDEYTKAYAGTLEMLEKLHNKGYTLGVVTSKSGAVAKRSIDFLGMAKYMQILIGAQDVDKHKPLPDPLLVALERLNRQPAQAAYVGDSPFDVLSAKAAKVKAIAVTWGMATKDIMENHQPDHIIDRWDELYQLL
ncbi:HAD hydrolase-like protein [Peptococcaceae bacterium 1198_IL3148]